MSHSKRIKQCVEIRDSYNLKSLNNTRLRLQAMSLGSDKMMHNYNNWEEEHNNLQKATEN